MFALALALALGATDPCAGTDALGRPFRTCFAPGRGLELSVGGAVGDGPGQSSEGAGLAAGLALRWRSDTVTRTGAREWLRDMAFVEGRARFHGSFAEPRRAEGTLWSAVFLRRLAEPFLLVPAPRPIRLPFPFDVGMALEAGSVRWVSGRARAGEVADTYDVGALGGALLLDVARHLGGPVRRAVFGPEVSWAIRFQEGSKPVQSITPFSAGRVELRVESRDGLAALAFKGSGGVLLQFPGETRSFYDARLSLERVLVAVNDVPLALYGEAAARGGALDREVEATAGVRLGWFR